MKLKYNFKNLKQNKNNNNRPIGLNNHLSIEQLSIRTVLYIGYCTIYESFMCLGLGLFTITNKALSGSLTNRSKCMPGYKIQGSVNIQVIWHFKKIGKMGGGGGLQLQRGGWSGGIYQPLTRKKYFCTRINFSFNRIHILQSQNAFFTSWSNEFIHLESC